MSRPRVATGCSVPECPRPHHGGGLCGTHYKAEKRGLRDRKRAVSKRDTRPPNAAPDHPPESLSGPLTAIWENGSLRRGDEFQVPGIVCGDCRRVATFGWCLSDRHPTFDALGYLLRMTPRARGVTPND